jgi:hypothetical protein
VLAGSALVAAVFAAVLVRRRAPSD